MKHWLVSMWVLTLTACSAATPTPLEPALKVDALLSLPDLGAAPELNTDVWLNSEVLLQLADLRGKVVLLEMWTFG